MPKQQRSDAAPQPATKTSGPAVETTSELPPASTTHTTVVEVGKRLITVEYTVRDASVEALIMCADPAPGETANTPEWRLREAIILAVLQDASERFRAQSLVNYRFQA
jgi:hypothetical protein